MPTSEAASLALIAEETEAVQALLALVENEQQALIQAANAEALQQLTAQKAEAVGRISELTRRRYTLLGTQGFRPDETGMGDWIAEQADPALLERWAFLVSIAQQIKTLNQMNGQLIAKLMSQNQTILSVFGIETKGSGLYGPDGRAQGFGTGYLK